MTFTKDTEILTSTLAFWTAHFGVHTCNNNNKSPHLPLRVYIDNPDMLHKSYLYRGQLYLCIIVRGVAGSKTMCNQRTSARGLGPPKGMWRNMLSCLISMPISIIVQTPPPPPPPSLDPAAHHPLSCPNYS